MRWWAFPLLIVATLLLTAPTPGGVANAPLRGYRVYVPLG